MRVGSCRPRRERVEGTEEQQVLGVGTVVRIGSQALRGFDDDGCRQVEVVVGGDGITVLGDGRNLGEGVEGAPDVELGVDDGEGFDAGANLEVVLRTPLATARTWPCSAVSRVMMRSASPSLWVRRTIASSR